MISRRNFLKASAASGAFTITMFPSSKVAEGNIGAEIAGVAQGGAPAPPKPWLEFVSVGDFGAIGDGDAANAETNSEAIQDALNTGKSVYLGGKTEVYAIATSLRMHSGQRIYGNGATLIASRSMSQILNADDDATIEGILFDSNNRQPSDGVPIQATGAVYGINIQDVSGCRVTNCTFTKYKRGISVTSSRRGIKCTNHLFEDCKAIAGFGWPSYRSGNEQLGAYVGSEARPDVRSIANYNLAEREAEDVGEIRFINWQAEEGQYGLALHRCSGVTVLGGVFRQMSRGISIQHQSRDITVSGVMIEDTDSAGIHLAQGASHITVIGNRIFGTMANDNAGVQGYYGVRDIVVANNVLDSRFDSWAGGSTGEVRAPGAAIRFGQQAQNIIIRDNIVRGYRWGIMLKSTIYDETIRPSDANYYQTGIRNITIKGNRIIGDYFSGAGQFTRRMGKSDSFGVVIALTGAWEDTSKGGWDVSGIAVMDNSVFNTGTGFATRKVRMQLQGQRPRFSEGAVRMEGNETLLCYQDNQAIGSVNDRATSSKQNSWEQQR